MFSEPLSFRLCVPIDTPGTQFRRLLATKFGTDWANLEKWKLWFCARGSIKIKPRRASICTDFVIFIDMCSKPVFFVISDMCLSNCFKFGYPFGVHFKQYIAIIWNLNFMHNKYKRSEFQLLLGQGYPGHITEEGWTKRGPGFYWRSRGFLRPVRQLLLGRSAVPLGAMLSVGGA